MRQRTSHRRTARTAVLLLLFGTVIGLVAMHGLPDAMGGGGSAAPMPAGVSMATIRVVTSPMTPHVSADAPRAGTGAHRHGRSTGTEPRSTKPSLAVPIGCGMDHANCVAVLRDSGHLAAAPAPLATVPAAPVPMRSTVVTLAQGPRAPPDVSLIGLGISRT